MSQSFESAKINTFFFGVEDFFKENPSLPANERMSLFREIKDALYKRAASFRRGNPDIFCYYVTTGTWHDQDHANAVIGAFEHRLASTNMLDKIKIEMVGARDLQEL